MTIPVIPEDVKEILEKLQKQGSRMSQHETERAIVSLIPRVPSIYIVLDALDECNELNRRLVLEVLERLKNFPSIRIFITSRPHTADIKTAFQDAISLLIAAHDADIRQLLSHELRRADLSSLINDQLATDIIETIVANAQGMYARRFNHLLYSNIHAKVTRFLLPVLQIRTILKEPTIGGMEDTLNRSYTSLPNAFEGTIARICQLPESRKKIGLQSLMWICHAKRPLLVWELSEALAVQIGQKAPRPKHRPLPKVILDCCQGLVSIDDGVPTVRVVHYAVQEYLLGHSDQLFPSAQSHIAETCLTYLLFDAFRAGPYEDSSGIEMRVQQHPFLIYASKYMGPHVKKVESDPSTSRWLGKFMRSRAAIAVWSQTLRWSEHYRLQYWSIQESNSYTALHVASHSGLEDTINILLKQNPQDINVRTSMGTTPLILASANGHEVIVRALLCKGADPYLSNWYGNALHCAAEAGSTSTIHELLRFGMDINIPRKSGETPLHCTTDNDSALAATLLIHNGANIDARDDVGMSVLHAASADDCPNTLDSLLQLGQFDLRSTSKRGFTALHYATARGNTEIVERLLECGADINARDNRGRTPLDYATDDGFAPVVELLSRLEL